MTPPGKRSRPCVCRALGGEEENPEDFDGEGENPEDGCEYPEEYDGENPEGSPPTLSQRLIGMGSLNRLLHPQYPQSDVAEQPSATGGYAAPR